MPDAILVLNAGSSSLKFSVFNAERGEDELLARGQVEGLGVAPQFTLRNARGEVTERQPLGARRPTTSGAWGSFWSGAGRGSETTACSRSGTASSTAG